MFTRLVKTAASRAAKEYRAEAQRQGISVPRKMGVGQSLDEIIQAGLPNSSTQTSFPGSRYSRLDQLRQGLAYSGSVGSADVMSEARTKGLLDWTATYAQPGRPHATGPGFRSAEGPAQVQRAMRDRYSGRHAGKPGEVLIPSGGIVNLTAGQPSPNYLFRGNRPQLTPGGWVTDTQGTPGILMSRHPDVAASYATQVTRGNRTPPTGRVFAFNNNIPGGWGSGPPDQNLTTAAPLADKTLAKRRKAQERYNNRPQFYQPLVKLPGAGFDGRYQPQTFEDLVPFNKVNFNKPVGEYTARMSRMPDGAPAFALRDVKGAPAAKVFPGAQQVPPLGMWDQMKGSLSNAAARLKPVIDKLKPMADKVRPWVLRAWRNL